MKIEIVSESEGMELCDSLSLEFKYFEYEDNKIYLIAEHEPYNSNICYEPKYIIRAKYDIKTFIYVDSNGDPPVTFDIKQATKFTQYKAKTKAFFMSKHGHYNWKAVKV